MRGIAQAGTTGGGSTSSEHLALQSDIFMRRRKQERHLCGSWVGLQACHGRVVGFLLTYIISLLTYMRNTRAHVENPALESASPKGPRTQIIGF